MLACIATGLVYAEFAVRIPQAGSAYTFTYTAFGEIVAWTVGWALTLEYAISGAATARSFGSVNFALVFVGGFFGSLNNFISVH
jgi:APA family basic amino acid/polyamine antiporter